jgi:2,3-dihydroxy-p-cumate/2,3-dihydroxybenzoate 3,4-dioxygenase
MILVQEFGFVTYTVPNLDEAVEFFRDICQLAVTERRDDVVFLTGDNRHAWIRLERGESASLVRLSFRVPDAEALEEVIRRLDAEKVAWHRAGDIRDDRILNAIRFRTPEGFEVELYEEQVELASSPAVPRGLEAVLHTVVFVEDVVDGREFWKRALGFKRSDQIEDLVVFLRCGNRYHHSIGLAKGQPGRLDHVCFLVDSIDTVVKFRNHARSRGVKAEDLVRHTASGSVSVYLEEPTLGIGVELCAGHAVIEDDGYNGRLLKASPETADRWSAGFPDAGNPTFVGQGGGTRAAKTVSQHDA